MAHKLNPSERLTAETAALRIVLQRLLWQLANQVGDPNVILPQEHEAALRDLEKITFVGASQERDNAFRAHAQRVLDEIHIAMRPVTPPKAE
jgi:hypothetical protein